MNYHHIAHLDSFEPGLKAGQKIKRGDLLGRCGKTGTTSPHCHYEIMREKPAKWTQYVNGLSLAKVKERYLNPESYVRDGLPMEWDHYGHAYLSPIENNGFHPGVDLNWGTPNADLGKRVYATTDGVIEYMGTNPKDGNWGNHLWWKETTDDPMAYDNHLIQDSEASGSFALVYKGKKHLVTTDRAGLAALTAQARGMPFAALTRAAWDSIPSGDNF